MTNISSQRDQIVSLSARQWLHDNMRATSEQFYCIIDERVEALHYLADELSFPVLQLPVSEELKNFSSAKKVWEFLGAHQADRSCHVIAVGGGVLTDLVGFATSTYMRGIKVTYIPTTLLGMVDAAIGGKNGINLLPWKNRVGTFYFPAQTILDPEFLTTLAVAEWRNGWAEVLKHALIQGDPLLTHVFDAKGIDQVQALCSPSFLMEVIQVKLDCVQDDLFDEHSRQKLNAGHTVGHAIESYFLSQRVSISHGRAVAAGLWIETEISNHSDFISDKKKSTLQTYIADFFDLPRISKADIHSIFELMKGDKKNMNHQITFSLVYNWGDVRMNQRVSDTTIKDALRSYCNAMENS